MKKKMLECSIHGLTLYRCKRKYWKTAKDKIVDEYTEKCFKCINEGNYVRGKELKLKRKAHLKV